MLVVIDVDSLERNELGGITGIIYIKDKHLIYPSVKWFDFPIVIVGWWLDEINNLITNPTQMVDLMFMDGPYLLRIASEALKDKISVQFIQRNNDAEIIQKTIKVSRSIFIESLLEISSLLIRTCHEKGWSNSDTATLSAQMDQLSKNWKK